MERTEPQYEGLPEGAQVLGEISSPNELEQGQAKAYFNPSNGKLGLFLGKAVSPGNIDGPLVLIWSEFDPVSGTPVENKDEKDAFSFPLLRVELPDGFLKFGKTLPEA